MPRVPKTRWIVVITALDNGQHEVFGPWYSYDTAHKVKERLVAGSEYYNGEAGALGAYTVQLTTLEPWRGVRAAFKPEA